MDYIEGVFQFKWDFVHETASQLLDIHQRAITAAKDSQKALELLRSMAEHYPLKKTETNWSLVLANVQKRFRTANGSSF
jgi:hypothetical protein